MRLLLPDALHARPANLLVRLAAQHGARVELRKGTCSADARKILDVLSLGAAKGDEIEIVATGDDAERAVAALAELVARNFDGDLVPEQGSAAVEGIAIGRAFVVSRREPSTRARERGSIADELARLREGAARAEASLESLLDALPHDERALFEPERAILDELAEHVAERVAAGASIEDAIAAVGPATTDLVLDAQARLVEALEDAAGDAAAIAASLDPDDTVLVAEALTPSLVAALPRSIRGIVAAEDDPDAGGGVVRTSHAAILARGREIPLAFVPPHVVHSIVAGEPVVVDTTQAPARVWVSPSATLLADAHVRRRDHEASRAALVDEASRVASALGVDLQVNVGSLHDRVPAVASGVGLLRTELLFAGRMAAPSEAEQVAAFLAVSKAARGRPVTVRLFDAGGDKPLPWLRTRPSNDDERGVALLLANPEVLATQCAALVRAAPRAAVRALIPMVRTRADVDAVRALLPGVAVGAMIETADAARDAAAIAAAADFVSIGTNDLTASVLGGAGHARGDATRALDPRVLAHVDAIVRAAHAAGKRVTVCGEVAADARGARALVGLGVDGLSVSPPRLADAVLALRGCDRGGCVAEARAALAG